VGGAGRPRAFVAVSRVAPDIVTVSLVRQDRRPCRRSKISAGFRHVREDERILGA
jgi:hypothetical protein